MKYAAVWQTPMATVTALVIFFPILMAAFVVAACLDFLQRLVGGWDGEGLSFYMIGVQWGFTSAGAIFFPHFVFKRGNPYVPAWTVIALTAAVVLFLAVATVMNGDRASLNEWLTFISIPLGAGIGALTGAGAVRNKWPKIAAKTTGPFVPAQPQ